jgi:2-octaprenylphenol hydroxylase
MEKDFDIAVCGGGLVGLMFANLLAHTNYRIVLIDAGPEPTSTSNAAPSLDGATLSSGYAPRVSALNTSSMALLERCDVLSLLDRYARFSEMLVKDGEGTGEIRFSAEDLGMPQLGMVIENHWVVEVLYQRLTKIDNVELLFDTEMFGISESPSGSEIQLVGDKVLTCDLVVGADGGNSKVREIKGLKTGGWSYDQAAIVTTIQVEDAHHNMPRQWFTADGPLAFLPLADPMLCSVVWSHRDAASILDLTPEAFCTLLTEASESDLGKVLAVDQRFSFPLKQQHAYRYVSRGVALIGDAAHAIHPLAGQGANLGFADAEALAMEIRQTQFSGEKPGDISVLRRFSRARQPHNLAIAAAMETLKQL